MRAPTSDATTDAVREYGSEVWATQSTPQFCSHPLAAPQRDRSAGVTWAKSAAGGTCAHGNATLHSAATPWQAVLDADPDVLVVAPCGFGLGRAASEMPALAARPGWSTLRAVRSGQVYVGDGNRYFNRSGPTAFETIPLLAEILHPEAVPRVSEGSIYRRW